MKFEGCNDCLEVTNESNPTVSENKVSFTISNENRQTTFKYSVDGGLIDDAKQEKCDYLMMFPECMIAFFIELKGQGWEKAVSQLENTVRLLYSSMSKYTLNLRAVIGRSAPKTNYIPLMKRRKAIVRRYPGATLEVKSRFADKV
jgi:hypothetical protein